MRQLDDWVIDLFAGECPKTVLFRVDAGNVPGLSFGHVSRCLTMAESLRKRCSARSVFAMRGYDEGVAFTSARGVEVVKLPVPPRGEQKKVAGILHTTGADWLVHDLPYPSMDSELFSDCRAAGVRTLFVDDARFVVPEVDVLLNSSIMAPGKVAQTEGVRMFLGPEYFLWDHREAAASVWDGPNGSVLLTFGGSDPAGLTAQVVGMMVAHDWGDAHFTVLLGPGFAGAQAIRDMVAGRTEFIVVENAPDPYPLYRSAKVVVCAGGRTMYELAALGKSFIAVASVDHERESVLAFTDAGHALAGLEGFDATRLAEALRLALDGDV